MTPFLDVDCPHAKPILEDAKKDMLGHLETMLGRLGLCWRFFGGHVKPFGGYVGTMLGSLGLSWDV